MFIQPSRFSLLEISQMGVYAVILKYHSDMPSHMQQRHGLSASQRRVKVGTSVALVAGRWWHQEFDGQQVQKRMKVTKSVAA